MRFAVLHPRFCYLLSIENGQIKSFSVGDSMSGAQGVMFYCPKCWMARDGRGVHKVICWFLDSGVPDGASPGPGRWRPVGTGIHDLSLVNNSSSVQLNGGCNAHFYVENGNVRMV